MLELADRFDVAILDEAHHLSNPKSARTKAVYGPRLDLSRGALGFAGVSRVWLLSATIQRNNVSELYPHLAALFPSVLTQLPGPFPTIHTFTRRYCLVRHTSFGDQIVGNNKETVSELREALRPHILRRLKRDVAKELGDIQHITLPVAVSAAAVAHLLNERAMADLDQFIERLENGKVDGTNIPANVSQLCHALGELKAHEAVTFLTDMLDADPTLKVVVFARHLSAIDILADGLRQFGPVVVHGGVTSANRAAAVDQFQTEGNTRVFIGQLAAASTSLTLTAASTVVLVEQAWTPADNYQAISRVHRLGQSEPVTAYYAYAADTVDERISRILRTKTADFEHLLSPLTTVSE